MELCLKSRLQAWFFEKGVLETLIFCLKFTHIFLCSCFCTRWGTHKHNNDLRYVSKLHPFSFQAFSFMFVCFEFLKSFEVHQFFRILRSLEEAREFSSTSLEALKLQAQKFQKRLRQFFLHPTSNFQCRKWEAERKKLVFGMCGSFQVQSLEACRGVEAIFFALNMFWNFSTQSSEAPFVVGVNFLALSLQLLVPNVGGQAQENLCSTYFECVEDQPNTFFCN